MAFGGAWLACGDQFQAVVFCFVQGAVLDVVVVWTDASTHVVNDAMHRIGLIVHKNNVVTGVVVATTGLLSFLVASFVFIPR